MYLKNKTGKAKQRKEMKEMNAKEKNAVMMAEIENGKEIKDSRNKKDKKEKCMLMFSGGYDTLLCVPRLISSGFKSVSLITFDNGAEKGINNVTKNAERLKKIYGESIEFLGVESIVGIWRKFLIPYFLGKWNNIQLLPMEMVCLTCRTSMYIRAITECLKRNIQYLAEGARESQGYSEQQSTIVERYKRLCREFSIELLLPVWTVKSKGEIKEELIRAGIIPKTAEPFCVLAMPLYDYQIKKESVKEMERVLDELIFPEIGDIIKELQQTNYKLKGEKEI